MAKDFTGWYRVMPRVIPSDQHRERNRLIYVWKRQNTSGTRRSFWRVAWVPATATKAERARYPAGHFWGDVWGAKRIHAHIESGHWVREYDDRWLPEGF